MSYAPDGPRRAVTDVIVLTGLGLCDRLYALRPTPPRLEPCAPEGIAADGDDGRSLSCLRGDLTSEACTVPVNALSVMSTFLLVLTGSRAQRGRRPHPANCRQSTPSTGRSLAVGRVLEVRARSSALNADEITSARARDIEGASRDVEHLMKRLLSTSRGSRSGNRTAMTCSRCRRCPRARASSLTRSRAVRSPAPIGHSQPVNNHLESLVQPDGHPRRALPRHAQHASASLNERFMAPRRRVRGDVDRPYAPIEAAPELARASDAHISNDRSGPSRLARLLENMPRQAR